MANAPGLTFDELARMLHEDCGIQTVYGRAIHGVRIRTEKDDHWVASVWLDEQKNLVLDMGQKVKP